MYSKQIPFKGFDGKPHNQVVNFNLTETQVFELFVEFKAVLSWQQSIQGPERTLEPEEVADFYRNFKEILLSAYGVPSDDGLHFRKAGRYDFEESALFNATMLMIFTDPTVELAKFMTEALPSGMEDLIKKVDENTAKAIAETEDTNLKAELEKLRAQLASQPTSTATSQEL